MKIIIVTHQPSEVVGKLSQLIVDTVVEDLEAEGLDEVTVYSTHTDVDTTLMRYEDHWEEEKVEVPPPAETPPDYPQTLPEPPPADKGRYTNATITVESEGTHADVHMDPGSTLAVDVTKADAPIPESPYPPAPEETSGGMVHVDDPHAPEPPVEVVPVPQAEIEPPPPINLNQGPPAEEQEVPPIPETPTEEEVPPAPATPPDSEVDHMEVEPETPATPHDMNNPE